ncbi:hypothetical protein M440DRAFT_1404349 [Trichoderma longibrachiatum ATCC 18648]|uniref:Uncharacterized protein n=1 Tax=Trichoderma longibrachiatum ATCC 18648 TaxID=983965 RepID=A0A2T4BVI6_TRILO|nr:hypothetical protein M440DRAFT_1404349 [Trichoderma longibrachiatum ATCC 18648]
MLLVNGRRLAGVAGIVAVGFHVEAEGAGMPCSSGLGLAASPWRSVCSPGPHDPGSVAVRTLPCTMAASWNSVPAAKVRRSPLCVRASCISSRLWAQRWRHAMADRLIRQSLRCPSSARTVCAANTP